MNSRSALVKAYRRHYNDPMGRLFGAAGCPTESRAEGSYVFDEDGRPYLDWCSGFGVFSLGHGNREILDRVRSQLESVAWLPPRARHDVQDDLRRQLARILPAGLNQVMLSGSGSEACEYALATLLLSCPGRKKVIAADNSYHGKTLGSLCLMGQPHLRQPFGSLQLQVEFVPYGDLSAMRLAVDANTLAVFLEPVLGGGHLVTPPAGYLAAVETLCGREGARLVLDEVQTGFGRTGTMFAFEKEGVVPDILMVSKAITGGCVPIALTIAHERIGPVPYSLDGVLSPSWHGSLLACVAGAASIEYLLEHEIPRQAAEKGAYLLSRLRRLAERHPSLVIDAPGAGLMLGLRVRSTLIEHALWLQLMSRGVIGGLSTNTVARHPVLRVFPPLTISYDEINQGLRALEESLDTMEYWPSLLLAGANRAFAYIDHMPAPLLRLACRAFRIKLIPRVNPAPA